MMSAQAVSLIDECLMLRLPCIRHSSRHFALCALAPEFLQSDRSEAVSFGPSRLAGSCEVRGHAAGVAPLRLAENLRWHLLMEPLKDLQ